MTEYEFVRVIQTTLKDLLMVSTKSSWYEKYDMDGDGVVSDDEFAHMAEIKRLERFTKQRAQRRMATASLVAMASFTIAMFLVDLERVKALADISNLFYITGGGIVSVYGCISLMNRNGKVKPAFLLMCYLAGNQRAPYISVSKDSRLF